MKKNPCAPFGRQVRSQEERIVPSTKKKCDAAVEPRRRHTATKKEIDTMPTNTQTPASELPTHPYQEEASYYFLVEPSTCYRGNYSKVTEIKSDAEAVMFRMQYPKAIYKNEYGSFFSVLIDAPRHDSEPEIRDIPIPVFVNQKYRILKKYLKSINYRQIAKMNMDDWEYIAKLFSWDHDDTVYDDYDYFPKGNHIVFGTTEDKRSPYKDVSIMIETTNFEMACQIALLFDEPVYVSSEPRLETFPSQCTD